MTTPLYNPTTGIGTDPNVTVNDLYQTGSGVGSGLTSSLQYLADGKGNTAPIQFSTTTVNIISLQYNGNSISISGALSFIGAYSFAATLTANTAVTFPVSGVLATLGGTETFTNKTLTSPTITGGTFFGTSAFGAVTASSINGVTIVGSTGASMVIAATNSLAKTYNFQTSDTVFFASTFQTAAPLTFAGAFGTTITSTATCNSTLPAGTHSLAPLDSPIFVGSNGNKVLQVVDVASATDYIEVIAGVANSASIQLLSSNTNGSYTVLAKGTGGVVIGSSGATTVPTAWVVGSNNITHSVPTLTSTRTVTWPDTNVKIASQAASIISLSGVTTFAAGTTYYLGNGAQAPSLVVFASLPFACVLSNAYIGTATAPGAGHTAVMTIYKNGSSTSLTATLSNTSTTASDTTHTVTCAAGDYIAAQIVMGAGAGNSGWIGVTLQCTAI